MPIFESQDMYILEPLATSSTSQSQGDMAAWLGFRLSCRDYAGVLVMGPVRLCRNQTNDNAWKDLVVFASLHFFIQAG